MLTQAAGTRSNRQATVAAATGGATFLLVAGAGLAWAKWWPYEHKLVKLWPDGRWTAKPVLAAAGAVGGAPSWHGAVAFGLGYWRAIWMALVVALVVAAGVEALVPRGWLLGALNRRRPLTGSVVGGLLAVPCMMCTCCSAPIAVNLRRNGVRTGPVLAYWVGNPLLNPAVLVFLAIVAPWQWVVTRVLVGAVLVFGVTAVIGRFAGRDGERLGGERPEPAPAPPAVPPFQLRAVPGRFLRALVRLAVTLLPEYAIVVLALGGFRGWLFPLGGSVAGWGVLAVLLAAAVGTVMVVPTAGEIPVLLALAAAGFGAGVLGALLITLPAVSLPSLAMVLRALSWRVTVAIAAATAAAGLLAGTLLWILS